MKVLIGIVCAASVAALFSTVKSQPQEHVIGRYSTSLTGRTDAQRFNAERAAARLNGAIIAPGATFSYNGRIGTFSADAGYRKAPVSYNGNLLKDWGGGVCQTSTTLYNATLLAGVPIVERFHHRFAPGYISPGRDAAVAFPGIDLRFKNNLPERIRIVTRVVNDQLEVELRSMAKPPISSEVVTRIHSIREPNTVRIPLSPRSQGVRSSGHDGFEVTVVRVTGDRTEEISHDSYPSMDRVIGIPQ